MSQNAIMEANNVCWRRIRLNDNIEKKNAIGGLVHYFMLSFIFVTIDSLQPLLLQEKFDLQKKDQIQNFRNMEVIIFDIIVKVFCAPFMGYIADRKGRKFVNLYGIICIGIAMILMPYAPQYYLYIILRCFFAQGAIAISVIPLLADYVHPQSRGSCAALLVFMSSIGALLSAMLNFTILNNIESSMRLHIQYGVAATIVFLVGLTYTLYCLKGGNTYFTGRQLPKKKAQQLWVIFKDSIKKPEITTGYLAAFLARSDSILLSLYLALWTYDFQKKDYDKASSKASALSGIAYVLIMCICILYGFYYQNVNSNKKNIMVFMLFFSGLGAILINFSNQIQSYMTYIAMGVLGIGMSGLLTASLFLVNQHAPIEQRGYLTGIQTLFGIIGITLQTFIGAILYEYVNRNGPFNYFGSACFACIIITLVIYYIHGKRQPRTPALMASDDQVIQN